MESLFVVAFYILPIAYVAGVVWLVIDASIRPIESKALWIVLAIVSLFTGLGVFIVVPAYLFFGRKKLTTTTPAPVQPNQNPDYVGPGLTMENPIATPVPEPKPGHDFMKVIGGVITAILAIFGMVYLAFFLFIMIAMAQCQASGSSKCY